MKYALHLKRLIVQTTSIKHKRHILEMFLTNPNDSVFDEERNQWTINNILDESFDRFVGLDIHAPIPDETFALFDPSKLTYKPFGNSSAIYILYGQAILSHIVKTEELQPFVETCVEKICSLSDDEHVPILYALFMEKYMDTPMTGGSSYSQEQLERIGNILIDTLLYDDVHNMKYTLFEFQKKSFNHQSIDFRGDSIIQTIILKYKVKLMEYIKKEEYPEEKWEIYNFLKIQKEKPISISKRAMIKTRKARKLRKNTKTRNIIISLVFLYRCNL